MRARVRRIVVRAILAIAAAEAVAVAVACGPSMSSGNADGGPGAGTCTPGAAACYADVSYVCADDGSGWVGTFCDPVQGVGCDIDTGLCEGACAPQYVGGSYIGCDYYPTVTANEVNSTFEFAVAVSNTTSETAHITIDWGALPSSLRFEVPPGEVRTQTLPWVPALKGCMGDVGISCAGLRVPVSTLAPKGAYRLRATRPVTVYQFNPLDYQVGDLFSYTNDASLLLPATALGKDYVVASWGALAGGPESTSPGFVAVTATADDTTVTITTRGGTRVGELAPAFQPDVPQTVTLHQGDVLELLSFDGDLTGSRVVSDKPVQVIGGHFCTFIPANMGWCDHLEESLFPVQSLSREYVVAAPAVPSLPSGKPQMVRIVAVSDDTTLSYDPPIAAATQLARAGDSVQVSDTTQTFVVRADKKVLVAQYMEGQEVAGNTGDPAMSLAVPTDQYRLTYQFHAPTNYETNYVEIVAPPGAQVMLDGAAVSGFTTIGDGTWTHKRIVLGGGERGDGDHRMSADVPFGVSVYGYGQYTSYWYPGGLDLAPIVIE